MMNPQSDRNPTIMRISACWLFALLIPVAQAQQPAPDVLVKSITEEVVGILKKDKDIQAGDTKKAADLIQTKVVPHFNFMRMTRIAMGRNWRLASPEQQKILADEFKTLLVRTYSTAIANYREQQIDYKPLRAKPGDTEVTVRSDVKQSGSSQPVSIDYEMEKTADGWKVYDVKVGGVSLVTTYRDTFAGEVREHGVDGLIKSLASKNRQPERSKAGKT
jgi:phospholipid transport system substrate-binding protein